MPVDVTVGLNKDLKMAMKGSLSTKVPASHILLPISRQYVVFSVCSRCVDAFKGYHSEFSKDYSSSG